METNFEAMEKVRGELSREKLASDLAAFVRAAEALMQATAGDASEKAKTARARLSDAVERVKTTCHDLQERTILASKAADQLVRDHPYESVGIAFGVGLLLGLLAARN